MATQIEKVKFTATGRNRRRQHRALWATRLDRLMRVADCIYNRGMSQKDTAKEIGVGASQVSRYKQLVDLHFVQAITDETFAAMGQHLARLHAMQADAYENMKKATHASHKIQWYRARLECLRDIARIMGFEKASASMVFEQGDERFVIETGGVDELLKLREGMRNRPINAHTQVLEAE